MKTNNDKPVLTDAKRKMLKTGTDYDTWNMSLNDIVTKE